MINDDVTSRDYVTHVLCHTSLVSTGYDMTQLSSTLLFVVGIREFGILSLARLYVCIILRHCASARGHTLRFGLPHACSTFRVVGLATTSMDLPSYPTPFQTTSKETDREIPIRDSGSLRYLCNRDPEQDADVYVIPPLPTL
jgi:hypothetical protein